MPQSRQILFIGLFIFMLLVTTCQSQSSGTIGDESQSPNGETSVSQTITPTAISPPTATPARFLTPSPIPTNFPTTPPTNTPLPPPTPTAIPVDATIPPATNTPVSAPVAAPAPNEVDLVTLEESLAVLDRVERRAEPTSTPVPVIIYEGRASSFVSKPSGGCYCRTCANDKFATEATISADGNVWGVFSYEAYQKPVVEFADDKVKVSFAGTQDSITGRQEFHANGDYVIRLCTGTLNAKLTNNSERFEGTIEETCVQDANYHWCGGVWTFSLPGK